MIFTIDNTSDSFGVLYIEFCFSQLTFALKYVKYFNLNKICVAKTRTIKNIQTIKFIKV